MNAKRTANLIVLHRQNRSCGLHSLNLIRRCVCKKIKDAAPSCICLHDIGIDKQLHTGASTTRTETKSGDLWGTVFLPSSSKSFLSSRPCCNSIRRTHTHPQRKKEDTHNCPPICPNLCQNLSCRLVFYMILSGIAHALRTPCGTIGVWVGYDVEDAVRLPLIGKEHEFPSADWTKMKPRPINN